LTGDDPFRYPGRKVIAGNFPAEKMESGPKRIGTGEGRHSMPPKKGTTKEILESNSSETNRTPLYNSEALEKLRHSFEQWRNTIVREEDRKNWYATPRTILVRASPGNALYAAQQSRVRLYARFGSLGPGALYPGYPCQYVSGQRIHHAAAHRFWGARRDEPANEIHVSPRGHRINALFDLPTIQMYDSDDPISRGQVGMSEWRLIR